MPGDLSVSPVPGLQACTTTPRLSVDTEDRTQVLVHVP